MILIIVHQSKFKFIEFHRPLAQPKSKPKPTSLMYQMGDGIAHSSMVDLQLRHARLAASVHLRLDPSIYLAFFSYLSDSSHAFDETNIGELVNRESNKIKVAKVRFLTQSSPPPLLVRYLFGKWTNDR